MDRSEVAEIYLNEPSLEGELDLRDFRYYEDSYLGAESIRVYLSPQVDETKLTFKNLPEKFKVSKISLINAQRDINYHFPTKQSREKVEILDIRNKKLEGFLNLSDFVNLVKL